MPCTPQSFSQYFHRIYTAHIIISKSNQTPKGKAAAIPKYAIISAIPPSPLNNAHAQTHTHTHPKKPHYGLLNIIDPQLEKRIYLAKQQVYSHIFGGH